ncbi:helix-turn-helix transcriptional regulator [Gracilibacillus sp. YIM 98692]|uniref:helix-turn-helix domain-containing protein n=1 Tax=Gracilibacillus sp. YIM 98692 TaxID=2663532 RepID=UPI0013D104A3|nr:helix-turn-helix transcriptional regulator [Gracilibacillus sp. YIM 98692]
MNKLEKDNFLTAIGAHYKIQRQVQGYTQEEVAEIIDVSERIIQQFEKGETNLSITSFVQLSYLLNVPYSFVKEPFNQYLYGSYQERKEIIDRKK